MRLNSSRDFHHVFEAKRKLVTSCFVIYAAPNALAWPRLGLVVSKRHMRLASQRNQVKRLCREHFRMRDAQIRGYDWVIIARSALAQCDKRVQHKQLEKLWRLVEVKWLK